MFTSRVEYRLIIREDNADKRLAQYGLDFGLLSKQEHDMVTKKYVAIEEEIQHLRGTKISPGTPLDEILSKAESSPLKQSISLYDLLKRPEINYDMIARIDGSLKDLGSQVIAQVEYEIKYEGFIRRQLKEVEKFRHIEYIRIPEGFDFKDIPGLSREIIEKLNRFNPTTLGAANRISGVTPSAISLLMIYLKKWKASNQV